MSYIISVVIVRPKILFNFRNCKGTMRKPGCKSTGVMLVPRAMICEHYQKPPSIKLTADIIHQNQVDPAGCHSRFVADADVDDIGNKFN